MTAIEHLYVHVPFCRRHCPYCDYAVFAEGSPDLEGWIEALSCELRLREAEGVSLSKLETLLVGGGTPSVFGIGAVQGIISILGADRLGGVEEWTVEANPEDVDSELLEVWREAGVNRVNIGVQSLRDSALDWLGRLHGPSQARSAIRLIRESRIPSWGVDLLFGLPEEVDPDPVWSLEELIAMEVPHVSLYELVVERGTPLGTKVRSGEVRLADDDRRADQYLALSGVLDAAGYEAYEMTAFARRGHQSRHALAVLEGRSWLGLGPGAHSSLTGRHIWNLRDWRGYSTAVTKGLLPEAKDPIKGAGADSPERLWFRLRRSEGIPRADLGSRAWKIADAWVQRGLAVDDPLRVRLTPQGWLRLDELSAELARVEVGVDTPSRALARQICDD